VRQDEPPERHIAIVGFGVRSLSQGDVITSGLTQITMDTAGILRPNKDSGVRFEPLIRSSTHAAPIPAQRFSQLTDPATLREGFKATGETYTVAARVTGTVKNGVSERPPGRPPQQPPDRLRSPLRPSR